MSIQLLETITTTSGVQSLTFSGIPNTGKELIVKFNLAGTDANVEDYAGIKINGLTSGYTYKEIMKYSIGSRTMSTLGRLYLPGGNAAGTARGPGEIRFLNYASSAPKLWNHKSSQVNNTTSARFIPAGWTLNTTTSAISSIEIYSLTASNFAVGTTASLYLLS